MECPRCGNDLDRYTLEGREAVSCGRCGYVGVPVEHTGDEYEAESWKDAVSRVSDVTRIESVTVESLEDRDVLEIIFEPAGSEDDDRPGATVVRVTDPDPTLAGALDAADDDSHVVCDVCGAEFERQEQLYGHLSSHSKNQKS
jgi:DNA-directed RNA polymerase subunit M/transcription elongation factor TFIIS